MSGKYTDVVINRDTAAKYGGHVQHPDGTSSDIHYVSVEDDSEKAWTTPPPPPHITLSATTTNATPIHEQSSVMISPTFDKTIVDPKDFSVLYLLLSDLQRYLDGPSQRLVDCWDLWQPVLKAVWENIEPDTADELMRIREEIENSRIEMRGIRPPQKELLKVLISVAHRHAIPRAYQVRGDGPQFPDLHEAQGYVVESAWTITVYAADWAKEALESVVEGYDKFAELARMTMEVYTIAIEGGDRIYQKLNVWLDGLCDDVRLHTTEMIDDMKKALLAFQQQVTTDIQLSDGRQYLSSLSIAFKRSVGVMLNASVHVRFANIVESLNKVYVQLVDTEFRSLYVEAHSFVEL